MTAQQVADLSSLPFGDVGEFTQGDFTLECHHDMDDMRYRSWLTCPLDIKDEVLADLKIFVDERVEDDTPDGSTVAIIRWQENSQQGA